MSKRTRKDAKASVEDAHEAQVLPQQQKKTTTDQAITTTTAGNQRGVDAAARGASQDVDATTAAASGRDGTAAAGGEGQADALEQNLIKEGSELSGEALKKFLQAQFLEASERDMHDVCALADDYGL